jgi:hypothetical protein
MPKHLIAGVTGAVLMAALTALSGRDLLPEEGDGDE